MLIINLPYRLFPAKYTVCLDSRITLKIYVESNAY